MKTILPGRFRSLFIVAIKMVIMLMIPRYVMFSSAYAGTENTYVIWKGFDPTKTEKKTTSADVCLHMIKEVSDLSRKILSGTEGEMNISHRNKEDVPFDVLHISFRKKDGVLQLELLNISTDSLDPFSAAKCLREGGATDAFGFIITENDPMAPERVFEVECRFYDGEYNPLVIEYNTDTKEIHFRYSNPNLNSVREPLKPEEAWFNLQSRMLRVIKPLKDYLDVFPKGVLPQESPSRTIPDKDLERGGSSNDSDKDSDEEIPLEQLDEPSDESYSPEKATGVFVPIANQPSWLQSMAQASHTPVVHSDQQVQKLRKEQSNRSTSGTVYLLGLFLFGLTIWMVFAPFLARRIRRRVIQ